MWAFSTLEGNRELEMPVATDTSQSLAERAAGGRKQQYVVDGLGAGEYRFLAASKNVQGDTSSFAISGNIHRAGAPPRDPNSPRALLSTPARPRRSATPRVVRAATQAAGAAGRCPTRRSAAPTASS